MTQSQIFAWILLSTPEQPAPLQSIIAMADGINRAIPTYEELRDSLGWLRAQGLVRKEGSKFTVTEEGSALIRRHKGRSLMESWDRVAAELNEMVDTVFEPEDLTPEEVQAAYRAYKKDFWRKVRELENKRRSPRTRISRSPLKEDKSPEEGLPHASDPNG